jgi:hypothetical protein
MAFAGNTWWTYLLFSLIASFALLGNSLVLYVLITKRSYLKQPYNIFIFSLALTDVLSGVFLVSIHFHNNDNGLSMHGVRYEGYKLSDVCRASAISHGVDIAVTSARNTFQNCTLMYLAIHS